MILTLTLLLALLWLPSGVFVAGALNRTHHGPLSPAMWVLIVLFWPVAFIAAINEEPWP